MPNDNQFRVWYGLRLRTTANPRTGNDDGALHLTVSQIRRSARQSAIVAVAYRAGEHLYSDYTRIGIARSGDLVKYGRTVEKIPKA